jgi:hypothetical protein
MKYSPMLLLHIVSGTLGMLSGFVAVFLRKGSREHGIAGNIFVITMLSLGTTGAYMAVLKSQPANILGGLFTFYLVATAWLTARRKDGNRRMLDWSLLAVIFVIGSAALFWGTEAALSPTGLKYYLPPGPYFMFVVVAALATVGDVRMLLRGGITGTQRIARHLWRMCFALFIAAASIFLARQHLFPDSMRRIGALVFLSFLPLLLMIFWLIRVRFANAYKQRAMVRAHA